MQGLFPIDKRTFLLLRWAMGLTNWLVAGDIDITLYIPIIIHVPTS